MYVDTHKICIYTCTHIHIYLLLQFQLSQMKMYIHHMYVSILSLNFSRRRAYYGVQSRNVFIKVQAGRKQTSAESQTFFQFQNGQVIEEP